MTSEKRLGRVRMHIALIAFFLMGAVQAEVETPLQDTIPITGYIVADCYLRIKPLTQRSTLKRRQNGEDITYVSDDVDSGVLLSIFHEAVLSTSTTDEFIRGTKKLRKLLGERSEGWQIKQQGRDAAIEISEVIILNKRMHVYGRVIRTVDGFAVVLGMVEARKWDEHKGMLLACVDSAKLLSDEELSKTEKCGVVGVDADGDYFKILHSRFDIDSYPLRRASTRDYYLNPKKNQQDKKGKVPKAAGNVQKSYDEQRCYSLIKTAFYDNWERPPWSDKLREMVLRVYFGSGGRIVNYKLEKGSGNSKVDMTVLKAARSVSRVPGLSETFINTHEVSGVPIRFTVTPR